MKNTYENTKKELDFIRYSYSCKGEIIFRTALQYIIEWGQGTFNDNGWVENQLVLIDLKHDTAEAEGKTLWIGREFERAIIECAREIAKVEAYSLLVYIQKEVWLSNEGGIDYDRAVQLLKRCMNWIAEDKYELACTLNAFEDIGFDDDEIEMLGSGYILDIREDEEDD